MPLFPAQQFLQKYGLGEMVAAYKVVIFWGLSDFFSHALIFQILADLQSFAAMKYLNG